MIKIFEIGLTGEKPWEIETNKFGKFLQKKGLPQQIRIPNEASVENDFTAEIEDITKESPVYRLEDGTAVPMHVTTVRFATNDPVMYIPDPRSMNVSVQKCGNLAKHLDGSGEVLVILLMGMQIPIVRYKTSFDIVNTFHNTKFGDDEKYFGCMIAVPSKEYDDEIIRMQIKDGKNFRFLSISGKEKDGDEIDVAVTSIIHNDRILKSLDSEWKKKKERAVFFNVSNGKGVRTSLIVGKEKDLQDEVVNELLEKYCHVKNTEDIRVFKVPNNVNPEGPAKTLMKELENILDERPKTRALTIYNDAVQLKALNKMRLLYVFGMDNHGTVTTLKSN